MSLKSRSVGVLMLNTSFPRYLGDIGNPDSFNCQVHYRVVEQARSSAIVTADGIDESVSQALLAAARELSVVPVDLLLTSCGFLGELQSRICESVEVPVLASSLELLPLLRSLYGPAKTLAVITYDSNKMRSQHLGSAATDEHLFIAGMQNSKEFYSMISDNRSEADQELLLQEVLAVGMMVKQQSPVAVILECTNLSPYKQELRALLGVPVFDVIDAAEWVLGSIA